MLDRWVVGGPRLVSRQGIEALVVEADRVWLREPDGLEWLYLPGRSGMLSLKSGRVHEPGALELLGEALAGGGNLVDVGANIGYFAVRLASTYPTLRVLAVEAEPATHHALSANTKRNNVADRVRALPFAASNCDGAVRITTDLGSANFVIDSVDAVPGSVEVPGRRLDDVVAEVGLDEIAVIKCDVEGAELQALEGASQILERFRPRLLLEVEERWTARFNYTPADLFAYLERFGYRRELVMSDGPGSRPRRTWGTTSPGRTASG